jgi:hypothetical protein
MTVLLVNVKARTESIPRALPNVIDFVFILAKKQRVTMARALD